MDWYPIETSLKQLPDICIDEEGCKLHIHMLSPVMLALTLEQSTERSFFAMSAMSILLMLILARTMGVATALV